MRRWISRRAPRGERWFYAVLLANMVLGTSSVLIPLMLSRVLDRSVGALGLLSGLVSLVGVLGSLVWGRLSDAAHRRKPFVVGSYGIVGLCFLAMAFVPFFHHFLWVNMLMNFFWVANASVTVLIVIENRDKSAWEDKVGRLNQMGAIGWVLGLVLGSGALALGELLVPEETAIRALFVFIALGGLAASLTASRSIPRTEPIYTERTFMGIVPALGTFLFEKLRFAPFHIYHRLKPKRVLAALRDSNGFRTGTKRFLGATFITFLGLGLFGIPLPLLLSEQFGFSSSFVFALFALQNLGVVFAFPMAAKRIKRRGNREVQIGVVGVRMLLFAATALFLALSGGPPKLPWLLLGFVIYGLSWSYLQLSGIALITRLARAENRGLALGLYNALAGVGWVVAGLLSGWLAQSFGYAVAFGTSAGIMLLALAFLFTVPKPSAVPEQDGATESDSAGRQRLECEATEPTG